jgi:hypothetical protein
VVADKKIKVIDLAPTDPNQVRSGGESLIELFVPEGMAMLQLMGTPAAASPWAWKDHAGEIVVADAEGKKFPIVGAWALVDDGGQKLLARFNSDGGVNFADLPGAGSPKQIWLAFIVPQSAQIKQVMMGDAVLKEIDVAVPAAGQ